MRNVKDDNLGKRNGQFIPRVTTLYVTHNQNTQTQIFIPSKYFKIYGFHIILNTHFVDEYIIYPATNFHISKYNKYISKIIIESFIFLHNATCKHGRLVSLTTDGNYGNSSNQSSHECTWDYK